MAGRAGAGRDGGAEAINVDGDIDAGACGDAGGGGIGAKFADLPDGEDVVAHGAGGVIAFLGGGRHVADAQRGDAGHIVLFRCAAHRVAVAVADAVADVDEIEMGVDLQDMDRPLIVEGADAGDVDGMVAADGDGQRARLEDGADALFDVGVAGFGIGMDDVGIADIHHADIGAQIGDVIFMVISPGMAEGEKGGGLAHRPWPEAGACAELGAEVEGRAEDGDIGLDPVPVGDIWALAEGRYAHEGQVQAAGIIAVGGHLFRSLHRMGRYRWPRTGRG